ncbi:MAG: ADP-ribosyl-[dinitrogen reductase] hydrolase [Myxococcota bacterium]|jgi:ADP-ribosyl-[dinitrogen reductase] hydrolase
MTDYAPYLEVAVAAAREAGDLLRAELTLEGGPRGHGAHADADDEAEALIRARLVEAFPDVFYRGEETGTCGPSGADLCWLVDPNDGTSSYLKGYRGSSVSIGLLDDGVPVLGVVNAYAAPDHRGDLFVWAEGCGPMKRNGRPVLRPPNPKSLGERSIVLGSQWADEVSEVFFKRVQPARFRSMPSIAYRLALVAAGDVTAMVSMGSPVGWDFGGGHALLRAMDLSLVNQDGDEVTYTRSGLAGVRRCFAGPPTIARELAGRTWQREPFDRPHPPLDLVRLNPGEMITDAGVLARAQGCLLGQLSGDSLGSLVEFRSSGDICAQYSDGPRELRTGGTWKTLAGQPTDDSELALSLARTLVRDAGFGDEAVLESYRWWYNSEPFDIGQTTTAALGRRRNLNHESQANGALMRVSPLGIFGALRPDLDLDDLARRDAALTHPHPVCGDASSIYARTIAHAIRTGAGAHDVFLYGCNLARGTSFETHFGERPPRLDGQSQGWVRFAFQNAFWHLAHATDFEEGIVHTVRGGGDTDTNAAIAGALLGAVYGREGIPQQWRDMVLSCRPLPSLATHPRPRPFWPVDALQLAERLLLGR